jgi:phytanoyl-CoA hydroxylase
VNVLNVEQRQAYDADGFVVVRGLLDPTEDLDPVLVEYAGVLERLARELYEAGQIASTYEELPFGLRLSQIYLIGPEIYSNPVQHVRIKPPEKYLPHVYRDERSGRIAGFGVGATPWHQDNGVVLPVADETEMTTVWVAVTDATVENGCLEVIRGSHRDGLLTHCASDGLGLSIPDPLLSLDRVVTCPMKRGDVLFMHRCTCHSSLPNHSEDVRISYDLRYNPVGQPTGREIFPGFTARSRANPASELRDPEAWKRTWDETRLRLTGAELPLHHRWNSDDPVCA